MDWLRLSGAVFFVLALSTATLSAQPPAAATTTAVLVQLTIKPDADRSQVLKVMPEEVRATVKLYLDGKIQQWYSRSDGRGVVFILNAADVDASRTLMDGLPLSKANLASFEFTALGPLTPLRMLIAPAQNAAGKENR